MCKSIHRVIIEKAEFAQIGMSEGVAKAIAKSQQPAAFMNKSEYFGYIFSRKETI